MVVRIGFVGLGIIAETHLAVLAEMPQAELVFTADPHSERAPVEFRGTPVPHHRSLADALDAHGSEDADLLVLATPTPTHADLAVEALTGSTARQFSIVVRVVSWVATPAWVKWSIVQSRTHESSVRSRTIAL